ncbi:MAG: DUF4079 domain-containing protein [Pseudanabaena sp. ELA607]|jgi:putative Mn2+ efflux pump MntP
MIQIPDALKPIVTFAHPVLMTLTLGLAIYAGSLGMKFRMARSASGEEKKNMMSQRYNLKHFNFGSIFLVLMVFGCVGGMAVTYINNNKLFVGPHLIAGLGLTCIVALTAALAPWMQQGKGWARLSHISLNAVALGIFFWQAVTGLEIVQKILASMAKAA